MRAPTTRHYHPWHAISPLKADVEVCVVAWLAWGVVAGRSGVFLDGPGLVRKVFGDVLEGCFGPMLGRPKYTGSELPKSTDPPPEVTLEVSAKHDLPGLFSRIKISNP